MRRKKATAYGSHSHGRPLQFETLERRLLLASDFGDAPSRYHILLVNNGARHEAVGPMLGVLRDSEPDALVSALADGDDASPIGSPDDEDGVTFGPIRVGQLGATATVNIQNAPTGARLDAWIDFNGDGNWNGPLERIASGVVVAEGNNVIPFNVPNAARPGVTVAHFRVSTAGVQGPGGAAADGEVEDYAVTITPPAPSVGAFDPIHRISSTDPNLATGSLTSVLEADIDRDGDVDVISGSGRIVLMENTGGGNFTSKLLTSTISATTVEIADTDGDNDLDLVFSSYDIVSSRSTLYWLENTPGNVFVLHTVASNLGEIRGVDSVDLDNDGDMDIVTQHINGGAWFENIGGGTYTAHSLLTATTITNSIAQDVNGDGRIDVVTVADSGGRVRWYENNGSQVFTLHEITTTSFPNVLIAADLDGDGDADIVTDRESGTRQIIVLENDGIGNFTPHPIDQTNWRANMSAHAADLDGDGDLDVYTDADSWYRNDGSFSFVEIVSGDGGFAAADLDGDGDLDLVNLDNSYVKYVESTETAITVAASQATIDEYIPPAGQLVFTRRNLALEPLTVTFALSGTAVVGNDYTLSGASPAGNVWSVTFAAGQSTAIVGVNPIADGLLESPETIVATLQPASSTVVVETPSSATITLTGNDPSDWGDAPATYVTLSAVNGPRHGAIGPRLGPSRDTEPDGQPSALADADDSNEGDDGITFGTIRPGMTRATVTVNVQNAPNGARITAWLDFDNDGTFSGALERIITDAVVVEGDNVLTFQVPAGALVGNTYARFRIRTDNGPLTPFGPAADGEVEDCPVSIAPIVTTLVPGDYPQNLTSTTGGEVGVFAVDLDRDGDIDALTASSNNDTVAWNENDGLGHFTQHIITTTADGARSVSAADTDGDGDLDIVAACANAGTIQIYYNGGNQSFTTTTISSPPASYSVFLADVDRDGRLDIVTGGSYVNFGYLAQTSIGVFTPVVVSIGSLADYPRAVYAADVDSDGDTDLLAAYWLDDSIYWFENQGTTAFVAHEVPNTFLDGPAALYAVDLDRDGDMDIIGAGEIGYTLYWFENNGSQVFTRRTVAANVAATSIHVADMDGDGDFDVLAALKSSGRFEWYKNNGSQVFTVQTIDATAPGAYSLYPADMDGDGDLDVLTQTTSGAVVWYQSAETSLTLAPSVPTVLEDSPTPVVFTFTRTTALTSALTVPFTVSGTAQFGTDYTVSGATAFNATSGTATFAPGASTAQVSITPFVDLLLEADKAVTLTALPGATYSIVAPGAATTTIIEHSVADFGDAPAPYPTTRTQNGARHAGTGPTLGASRDSEIDGQPVAGAIGDDAAATADENGVTFGTLQPGLLDATVTANVQNAPAGARLDAWIDFDGDGTWYGAAEQIAINLLVIEGDNVVHFDIPATARLGTTYVRFRLSTAGNLKPTGMTSDGEVEDYAVTIVPPHSSPGYFSEAHVITSSAGFYGGSVIAADVDNDGDIDLLDNSQSNQIVWHLNDGNQNFTAQAVVGASGGAVAAIDFDRDGDLDVVATNSNLNPGNPNSILWYENIGSLVFTQHTAVTSTTLQFARVQIADLDGDGDLDLVTSGNMGQLPDSRSFIAVYFNDGSYNFTGQTLLSGTGYFRTFSVVDFNRDGRADFIASSPSAGLTWYENLGTGAFTAHSISTLFSGIIAAIATDLDRDGDIDIVYAPTGGNAIAWVEQATGPPFINHSITTIPNAQARSLQVNDFDGDGDIDIAWSNVAFGITGWNVNNGSQVFTYRTLTVGPSTATFFAADIDRDGDLDLAAAGGGSYLAWHENLNFTPPQGDYNHSGAVESTDYNVWRQSFGSTIDLRADGTANGSIDAGDYVLWRRNLSATAIAASVALSFDVPTAGPAVATMQCSLPEIVQPGERPAFVKPIDLAFAAFQPRVARNPGSRPAKSPGLDDAPNFRPQSSVMLIDVLLAAVEIKAPFSDLSASQTVGEDLLQSNADTTSRGETLHAVFDEISRGAVQTML